MYKNLIIIVLFIIHINSIYANEIVKTNQDINQTLSNKQKEAKLDEFFSLMSNQTEDINKHYDKAKLYEKQKQYEKALKELKAYNQIVITKLKESSLVSISDGYKLLAKFYIRRKDYKKAIEYCDKAIEAQQKKIGISDDWKFTKINKDDKINIINNTNFSNLVKDYIFKMELWNSLGQNKIALSVNDNILSLVKPMCTFVKTNQFKHSELKIYKIKSIIKDYENILINRFDLLKDIDKNKSISILDELKESYLYRENYSQQYNKKKLYYNFIFMHNWFRLGENYYTLELYEKANNAMKKSLKYIKKSKNTISSAHKTYYFEIYRYIGSCYFRLNMFSKAIKPYKSALNYTNNMNEINHLYYHIASSYYVIKKYKIAKQYIDKAFELCIKASSKYQEKCREPISRVAGFIKKKLKDN
jgi:tetratricopeptide (TPR) repeat protein